MKAPAPLQHALTAWLVASTLAGVVAVLAVIPLHTKTVTKTVTEKKTVTVSKPITVEAGTKWLVSLPIAGSFVWTLGGYGKADCVGTKIVDHQYAYIVCHLRQATP